MFPLILTALPQIISGKSSVLDNLPPRILQHLLERQSLSSAQQLDLATPPPRVSNDFEPINDDLMSILSILKSGPATTDEYAQLGRVFREAASILHPQPTFDEKLLLGQQSSDVLPRQLDEAPMDSVLLQHDVRQPNMQGVPLLLDNSKVLLDDMTGYIGSSIGATAGDLVKTTGSLLTNAASSVRDSFAQAIVGVASPAASLTVLNMPPSSYNDGLLQNMVDALVQPWSLLQPIHLSNNLGASDLLLRSPSQFQEFLTAGAPIDLFSGSLTPESVAAEMFWSPNSVLPNPPADILPGPAIARRAEALRRNLQGLRSIEETLKMLLPGVSQPLSPTKGVVGAWNDAIKELEEVYNALHIPKLDNYNWSLPETNTVGNGAVTGALNELLGQNLGSSIGSYYGNLLGGTSGFVNNYIQGAKDAFLNNVGGFINGMGANHRRLIGEDFGHALRLLAEEQPIIDETKVSCAKRDVLYRSPQSVSFNGVSSLKICQSVCQVYSSPLAFTEDCNVSSTLPCLAVSYNPNSGRCHLLFSIEEKYDMVGYESADVVCSGEEFIQTASQLDAMKSSPCKFPTNVVTVPDASKPLIPFELPPVIPEMPEFFNENVNANSMWRYNPDIPVRLANVVESNVIYQVGYGVMNVEGEIYWGYNNGIKDWRGCAYLCSMNNHCEAWTYYFNPNTYQSSRGGCSLASAMDPRARVTNGSVNTLSGPRFNEQFPTDLFGTLPAIPTRRLSMTMNYQRPYLPSILGRQLIGNEEFDDALKELNPQVPCMERGFVYFSLMDSANVQATPLPNPTIQSIAAITPEMCETACGVANGCTAWQFVPSSLLITNKILASSQKYSCILLSDATKKVASHPYIHTGIVTRTGRCEADDMPTVSPVNTQTADLDSLSTRATDLARSQALRHDATDTPTDTLCRNETDNTTIGKYLDGVSIRGDLIARTTNVQRKSNLNECHKICKDTVGCKAFTWGAWGGCYLLETVIAYVEDIKGQVISSLVNCGENPMNYDDIFLPGRRLDTNAASPRAIESCSRARRGLVYTEGSIINNSTDYFSANECWLGCRTHKDCFYMTYLDGSHMDIKRNAAWCLWFDSVAANDTTRASLAYSGEPSCDVIGELEFDKTWISSLSRKKINLVAAIAGATGSLIAVLGIALTVAYTQRHKASDATFLSNLAADDDEHEHQRNAFGMVESPANTFSADDFQEVEPKSTAKTRKRELFI